MRTILVQPNQRCGSVEYVEFQREHGCKAKTGLNFRGDSDSSSDLAPFDEPPFSSNHSAQHVIKYLPGWTQNPIYPYKEKSILYTIVKTQSGRPNSTKYANRLIPQRAI